MPLKRKNKTASESSNREEGGDDSLEDDEGEEKRRTKPPKSRRSILKDDDDDGDTADDNSNANDPGEIENDPSENGEKEDSEQFWIPRLRRSKSGDDDEDNDHDKLQLKNAVSRHTILYVPFLAEEDDLEYDQPFAKITMYFLGMANLLDEKKRKFWNMHKKSAKSALNSKRSNMNTSLMKTFLGTYCKQNELILLISFYSYNY